MQHFLSFFFWLKVIFPHTWALLFFPMWARPVAPGLVYSSFHPLPPPLLDCGTAAEPHVCDARASDAPHRTTAFNAEDSRCFLQL